ncbi:hypothetical protein RvY_02954 [Ramazzottius varieornatus]|uniref:Uncharacterized protein n=1 Tax=Ramazzottius varieornatus TaxID=947166 RepID=A0A1D1US51_RAMVA|nr:hypothetical protein RvY_02954 [Ramazzottius varieornatus]
MKRKNLHTNSDITHQRSGKALLPYVFEVVGRRKKPVGAYTCDEKRQIDNRGVRPEVDVITHLTMTGTLDVEFPG